MSRFYFTYGTDLGFPYQSGWTEVEAPDMHTAVELFRKFHPDRHEGLVNCAGIYSEGAFKSSGMAESGNFDYYCRERIRLTVEVLG